MANLRRETRETRETRDERETRHNNSPPTKKLRLRLGLGGVVVTVGLGWGSAIYLNILRLKMFQARSAVSESDEEGR